MIKKTVKGRLKNYLAFCQRNVRSLRDFCEQFMPSCFCTIPKGIYIPITIIFCATLFLSFPVVHAETGAELFTKLTCYSCHGNNGMGMFREKTKEKYRFKSKIFKKLKKKGVPGNIIAKLKPLNKKKFTKVKKFFAAIEELIGTPMTQKYWDLFIEHAGRVYYRKGDIIAGFEDYPRLAGNKEIYLYQQMTDIFAGRRTNGNTKAMLGIKQFLDNNKVTDQDFRAIAKYLSKQ